MNAQTDRIREIADRLRRARSERGFRDAKAAAKYFGWNYNTYSQHERGERGLKQEVAQRYATAFRVNLSWLLLGDDQITMHLVAVPIAGEVAAGVWIEAGVDASNNGTEVAVPPDPALPAEAQFAVIVRGSSMNKVAFDGDILICVNLQKIRQQPNHHDLVIVERQKNQGSLREVTLKRFVRQGRKVMLMPESTDPAWQTALDYSDNDADDAMVRVIGRVLYIMSKPRPPA